MVGSFFKVFLVTLALLVANSEALKCVVKGDSATANELSQPAGPMEEQIGFKMNVKTQEECDGMCIYVAVSGRGKTTEAAGCQTIFPSKQLFASFFAMTAMTANGVGDYRFYGCNADNCNAVDHPNHATMMNIQKIVENEGEHVMTSSGADLKCHNENGVSEACPRTCALVRRKSVWASVCNKQGNMTTMPWDISVFGRAGEGGAHEVLLAAVGCSMDNCNDVAKSRSGQRAAENIESKVEAELAKLEISSAGNNSSYGFILALVVSIILITVDF